MNFEIGISIQLSCEYLRVGRKLQALPTVKALFRVGKLSWSKVRLITRVANGENEKILCHAALDASVSDVKRLCEEYRWNEDENNEGENARALKQWTSRALTWNEASNGCTRIQIVLPPEVAQAFLNSVEQSLKQMGNDDDTTDNTLTQSRADAAVLMAETSLQYAGSSIASADRYQVCVSIDASELATNVSEQSTDASELETDASKLETSEVNTSTDTSTDTPTNAVTNTSTSAPTETQTHTTSDTHTHTTSDVPPLAPTKLPTKRPSLLGAGPIATETARRIACDCSLSINITNKSEPIDIGRKSRIWPAAMARAIKERDQQCVWPGCTHSRHLHIHHIEHWANGGGTSPHNGACLCAFHHMLVHEDGYTIEHINADSPQHYEQFIRQQHNQDISQFDFEKSLRTDQKSFNTVRKLIPTRFRYEIRDSHGKLIPGRSTDDAMCAEQPAPTYVVQVKNSPAGLAEPKHIGHKHIGHKQTDQTENIRVYFSSATREKTNENTRENTSENTRVFSDNRCNEAIPDDYYGKQIRSYNMNFKQENTTASKLTKSNFNREFKRLKRCSPSQWRESQQ